MFQLTPNTENYQARYIVTHPATGNFDCEAGKKYLKELKQRRTDEIEMLAYLTGKGYSDWDVVENDETEKLIPAEATYATVSKAIDKRPNRNNVLLFAGIGVIGMVSLIGFGQRNNKKNIF